MANYGAFLEVWGGAITYQGDNVILIGYGETNANDSLSYIKIDWTGKNASGSSVTGSKTLYGITYTQLTASITGSASHTTTCSVKYPGTYTVTVSNGELLKAWSSSWTGTSSSSSDHSYSLNMATQEVNGVLNIGAWDYGSAPDMSGTFRSFSISWNGYDKNGKAISGTGTPTIMQKSKTYIEADLNTALDFGYKGSATGTLVTTYASYACKTTWGSKVPSSSNSSSSSSSVLSITSFIVDDANTTGMVDGKYVIGTKLRLKVTVKSTYGTKSVRFVLTGAKESDNSWNVPNQTTITADSTAIATGVINAKCIVTDNRGNTASKTLDITIYGEGNNYYAYYFFNNNLVDAFKQDLGGANIILYNVYGVSPDQVDPRKKIIQCYGHNYKTYNDVKNKKHNDSDLTLITSFVVPDEKNVPKSVVHLTENEFKKLKKFKGLVFKIQNNNCLTIHDVKCEVEVIYK